MNTSILYPKERKPAAFTLIELLIVVAIIAILAAIAVPNFLEAQTRSKISRVKSDMRSLATAIESYAVDTNHYLPTYHEGLGAVSGTDALAAMGGTTTDANEYDSIANCGQRLTTPVAYIASIPIPSPFYSNNQIWGRRGFFYSNRNTPRVMDPRSDWWCFDKQFGNGTTPWMLMDGGPDRSWFSLGTAGNYEVQIPYDPTNGTVSRGNIFWMGGGGNK